MTRHLLLAGVSILASTFSAGLAQAQQTATPPADPASIPTVVVDGEQGPPPPYRVGEGVDAGTTVFDAESIETRAPGTGDVLQILKQIAGVQFSMREGESRGEMLRDLRPSQISISGGRPTENLFILDGVDVNSQMEIMSPSVAYSSAPDYDSVGAASPQSVWVDSDLVGQLVVHEANVSAEYGQFTGGVVEIITREPSRRFGMTGSYSFTGDNLATYHLSPSYSGAERERPAFDRERWSVTADLPIRDNLGLLLSYSRAEASTYNTWSANLADFASQPFDQTNVSQTMMAKLAWEPIVGLDLSAQVTYAPYTSVYIRTSGINTLAESQGGGTTARFTAAGVRGDADWNLNLTYAFSDNDKEAADWRFDVRGGLEPFCLGALTVTCENGHVGAINQRQENLSLTGNWSQPFWDGDLRVGFDFTQVDAEKSRRNGGVYSFSGTTAVITQATGPLTSCASPTDISCVEGRYAYNRRVMYPAYNAQVSLESYGLWAEYAREWNGFDIRAGLRYDHETFLSDHNFSPRLSIARELPYGIQATLGLNRYHGRSYLGYAIREQLTNTLTYGRTFSLVGGRRVWSDNWVLSNVTIPQRYSGQGLDTPYSDEISLNLTGPLLGGQWRVAGVYREGRNQFARSLAESFTLVDELGATRTINRFNMTNDGESTYEGVNLTYTRPWRNHVLTLSTAWSDTRYSADSYYDVPDDDVAGDTLVVFQGEIIPMIELYQQNQRLNFAAPFILNMDWTSTWFDERLNLNFGGRFRGDFERVEQTSDFTVIGGTRYRVFDVVQYHSSFDLDANVSYALLRGNHDVTLEARISNVLDRIPDRDAGYSSTPWQLGRSAWFGIRVRY